MKFHNTNFAILFFLLIINFGFSQEKQVIRLGVKKQIPDTETENLISKNEYNFIDAFEYELTKQLIAYAKKSDVYELQIIPINQSNKLSEIKNGTNIDALLYTFSQTSDRIQKGIHFSIPYFQNKAIGVIVNDEGININNIKEQTIRIGYVSNTTTEKELLNLYEKHKSNTILNAYENHTELINALKIKEIDAASGDVSRLIYDVNEGEFYFGGNLPTKRSKIRDNYCIAMSPTKGNLKPFFDGFIDNTQKNISFLEKKWLSTALEDAYQSHYNQNEDKLKEYIKYIITGSIALFSLLSILFYFLLRRKNKEIKKIESDKTDTEFGRIASLYDAKGRASIESAAIAEIGCDFFKTAEKKIIYVGSGGFLSDPNKDIRDKWDEALHDFIQKPGKIFERVVDLPKMEVSNENEARFSNLDNFKPQNLDPDYITRYTKWLFIQYINLHFYKTLKIVDSRGAALWGYGIVIMIKDEKEVLIFTTNRDIKIGSCIRDEKLAKRIAEIIHGVKIIGTEADSEYLKTNFFTNDPRATELITEINKLTSKEVPSDLMNRIDAYCKSLE